MAEKPGSRVELPTWPTRLVLEADTGTGQAAALVDTTTKSVTPLAFDGRGWSIDLSDIAGEVEVVVYHIDEHDADKGPTLWKATVSGRTFEIEKAQSDHGSTILMSLYRRNNRRMAKISGDGHVFGIGAYARTHGIDRAMFEARRHQALPIPDQVRPQTGPYGADRLLGQGSGVSVGPGLIVTNHHVVDRVERLVVVHDGRRSEATVILSDKEHDIALLRHDIADLVPVRQRDPAESHLGEEILAAGFPLAMVLGDDLKMTYGNVSGLRGGGDVTRLQFTAPIASGSSGGALLDMSGRLVGLVSAALRHRELMDGSGSVSENVNFAVKASLVRECIVSAGRSADAFAPAQVLGRAALAQIARGCAVSIDCYGR